jgi:hypothetical protein
MYQSVRAHVSERARSSIRAEKNIRRTDDTDLSAMMRLDVIFHLELCTSLYGNHSANEHGAAHLVFGLLEQVMNCQSFSCNMEIISTSQALKWNASERLCHPLNDPLLVCDQFLRHGTPEFDTQKKFRIQTESLKRS